MKKLYKVRLTDPFRINGGSYTQQCFIVLASSGERAIEVCKEENESAFVYNPAIEVEEYERRTLKIMSARVKLPAEKLAKLFPSSRQSEMKAIK